MNRPSIALLASLSLAALVGCETLEPHPGPQPGDQPEWDSTPPDDPDASDPTDAGLPADAAPVGDPDAIDGRLLYLRYCAVCHGSEGRGGPSWPESIRNMVDTFEVINQGRGEMPAFPALTGADVLAIEHYLSDDYVGPPVGDDPPDDPPIGPPLTPEETYATTCAVCHGVAGDGTPRGPQIRFPVRFYAEWVIRNGRSGIGFSDAMPAYSEAELPEETLFAILDWLSSFPEPGDGAGLWRVYCGNCHGDLGHGGPVGESVTGDTLSEWDEVVREGEGYGDFSDREEYMPAWTREEISAGELRAMWLHVTGGAPGLVSGDEDSDEDSDEDPDEDEDHDSDEH